ncbi:MAG: chromosomal replication initiator protein DnaA [Patescibacteria group bacterium]|nr:chromosomal replication initiator protein DnaA [Patescibacteria group bacterium]
MDNKQLWQAILGEMELLVSKPNFITWFKQTYIYSFENNLLTIAVPNAFSQDWFERKYHAQMSKAIENITDDHNIKIIYKIITKNQSCVKKENQFTKKNKTYSVNTEAKPTDGLNSKYTFSNFIIGKGNELAHAASKSIVKKPGETYNPLFIYGGVGLGKTHLMQAIGNEITKKYSSKKALYIPCEKFVNDFINALSVNNVDDFKNIFRNIDLLLIDDIQFLSGKEQTQEAFFHTFNELHHANKQIVLTSDRPPKAIATLEDRMISRFEWGMIADISAPDLETRSAILKYKAKEKNFRMDTETIGLLAENIKNNVRELEGALNKLIAYHQIENIKPTTESVQRILSNLTKIPRKNPVNIKTLINLVSEFYNISNKDLLGACRKKNLVVPRQITMYLMREEIKSSYPSIGNEIGGRDHTTVIHGCEKIEKQLKTDETLKQDIEILTEKLYNSSI